MSDFLHFCSYTTPRSFSISVTVLVLFLVLKSLPHLLSPKGKINFFELVEYTYGPLYYTTYES